MIIENLDSFASNLEKPPTPERVRADVEAEGPRVCEALDAEALSSRLADQGRDLLTLQTALQEVEGEVLLRNRDRARLQARVSELEAELALIYGSTIWRLTAIWRRMGLLRTGLVLSLNWWKRRLRRPRGALADWRRLRQIRRFTGPLGGHAAMHRQLEASRDGQADLLLLDLSPERARLLASRVGALVGHPLISVTLGVSGADRRWLEQAVDAVCRQVYPNWQLCLASDAARAPLWLRRLSGRDPRIRLAWGADSLLENRALALAEGEFVLPLEARDLLLPHALLRLAESISEDAPDLIYADDALFSTDRCRLLGYRLRPAFSPERLRSHHYIGPCVAYRGALLQRLGGFDPQYGRARSYDLLLRACEISASLVHIPDLIQLVREPPALSPEARTDWERQETAALEAHLGRCKLAAKPEPSPVYRMRSLRYSRPPGQRVAIVIPSKNQGRLLLRCVRSLRASIGDVDYAIVVVDHASDEPDFFRCLGELAPGVRVMRYTGCFNYSAMMNWAARRLGPEFTHFLWCNNDVEALHSGWLEHMLGVAGQPDVGVVGVKLLYSGGHLVQHAGVWVGFRGTAEHLGKFESNHTPGGDPEPGYLGALVCDCEVSAVTAACCLVEREVFERIGGFDEAFVVGFGDVDLCLRARRLGYRVVVCGSQQLVHHESYSRGRVAGDPHPEDSARFRALWGEVADAGDPFYNPGLKQSATGWAVDFSPRRALDSERRVLRYKRVSGVSRSGAG